MAAAASACVDKGFRAVKFGWGVFGEDGGRDRELVAAARQALGPERTLLVDPGWYPIGWKKPGPMRSRREALALCEWLAEYDGRLIEDFIHSQHFDEYPHIPRRPPAPIAPRRQGAAILGFHAL